MEKRLEKLLNKYKNLFYDTGKLEEEETNRVIQELDKLEKELFNK